MLRLHRFTGTIGITALLVAGSVHAQVEPVHERDRVHATLTTAEVSAHTDRIHALARDGDTAALAAFLTEIESDRDLPDVARTALLHQGLVTAGGLPPEPALRPLLERHAATGEAVRAWHEDEGHRIDIAMFDTAAAARFALREWRRHDAGVQAQTRLDRGTLSLAAIFGPEAAAGAAQRAGYTDAITRAPDAQLARLRGEIHSALHAGWPVERIALAAAVRLGDRDLAATLLQHGRAGQIARMLPELAKAFPSTDAAVLLTGATRRDAIASAAIARLGALAPHEPQARNWLVAHLGHRAHGAAAAHALALSADADTVAQLGRRLREDPVPLAQSRAALSLHLSGRPDAHSLLADFAADPAAPARLQRQIGEWLR